MCQSCVAEGLMTQEQLDEMILAGDRSVLSYADRAATGEDPEDLLNELLGMLSVEDRIAFDLMTEDGQVAFLSGRPLP